MKDNEIFMSKGDDVAFSISLTDVDGKPYTLQAGDKLAELEDELNGLNKP